MSPAGEARRDAGLLALVMALALGVRLHAIGAKSLWIDEAYSIWTASHPLADVFRLTVTLDQHPPTYYALLHAWLALGDSEAAVRGLSAAWGVLTIPVAYLIGERAGGRVLGLLAALLLAVSPLHVSFAQQARMYTMLTFWASLCILCMLHLLVDRPTDAARAPLGALVRDRWWIGFALTTTLTLLSHNTAVFLPATIVLFVVLAFALPALRRHDPLAREAARTWLLGLAAAFLLWLPWLPWFVAQCRRVDAEFWIQPPTLRSILELWRNFGSAFAPDEGGLVLPVLALLAVAGLGAWRLRDRPVVALLLVLLVLAPFAGSLLVSLRRPIFFGRTLIWTSVPLYVLVAAGLLQLRRRALVVLATATLVLINAASLVTYFRFHEPEDWRGVAALVAERSRPGDVVLFNAGWMQIPFDYYYRRTGIAVAEHGLPADLFERGVLEPKMTDDDVARLDGVVAGHPRAWLVYSHDWYTDPGQIIPRRLEETRGLVSAWRFRGVRVALYE